MLGAGAVVARLSAATQRDIKSLVAFSSVRHIGVLMFGLIIGLKVSTIGAIILAVAHGFCSSALFYMVNFFFEKRYSRQILTQSGNLLFYMGIPLC